VLRVRDTGSGMSPEVMERAFEPFFTTKDVGGGTGLGLSQVYGFVKQSGGHAKIASSPGNGTTVTLYLPRHSDDSPAQASAVEVAPEPAGGEELVLVVEDDAEVRAHSCAVLRELGYRVVEASEGKAALRLLEENAGIGLLFSYIGLPGGIDGRQLAAAAQQRRPGLRVVLTTGYAHHHLLEQVRLEDGLTLILKPFTFAELSAKLRAVLRG